MKVTLVGIKHVTGVSKKNNQPFDFYSACLVGEMAKRDIEKGSSGSDVYTPTIPDRYADIFTAKNIGKEYEVEFYFANNRVNIGYVAPAGK